MLQQKCSPAVLLSQSSHVQLRSGHWKESWVPQPVWRRAKLSERCWHIVAYRLGSTGWCTGRFPGYTALKLWVQATPVAIGFPLHHDKLHVFHSFRFSRSDQQWKKEESSSANPEESFSCRDFFFFLLKSHKFCRHVLRPWLTITLDDPRKKIKWKYNYWLSGSGLFLSCKEAIPRDWMGFFFLLSNCKRRNSAEGGCNTGTWCWLSCWKHLCVNSICLNISACTLNWLHFSSLDNK